MEQAVALGHRAVVDAFKGQHANSPLLVEDPEPRDHDLADILEHDVPADAWDTPQAHAVAAAAMREDGWAALDEARREGRVGVLLKTLNGSGEDGRRVRVPRFDGNARTIVCSDGHTGQRVIVPTPNGFRLRKFTPRELARLNGAPEDYEMPRSIAAARRLVGDAIVVPVYRHLTRHLLVPLARSVGCEVRLRPQPRRQVSERHAVRARGNRAKKRACHSMTIYLLPEAHARLKRRATAAGRSMEEELFVAYDRMLLSEADAPLPRYARAAKPRRKPKGGGGGKRRAPGKSAKPKHARPAALPKLPAPAQRRGAGARARLAQASTPLRYPGGKAQVASRLVQALAGSSCLIEPFAGGASAAVHGVVSGAIPRAVLAEKDAAVRGFWRTVLEADWREFAALVRTVEAAEPTRAWWEAFRQRVVTDPAPHLAAAHELLLRRFHWGAIPSGGVRADRHLADALRGRTMARRLEAIRSVRHRFTLRDDAAEVIAEFSDEPRFGFLVDPPYTVGDSQPGRRLYRHHEVDHAVLLTSLRDVKGKVLVTYPDDPLVRRLARKHGFQIQPLNVVDAHRRQRQELLLSLGIGPPDG